MRGRHPPADHSAHDGLAMLHFLDMSVGQCHEAILLGRDLRCALAFGSCVPDESKENEGRDEAAPFGIDTKMHQHEHASSVSYFALP